MQRVAKGTGSPFWQPSSNTRKGHKSEERKEKAATGGLLTRAIQALALRVLRIQICSRQICLWLLSFGRAKDKFARSEFGQL
jgi:hypothetical protein